MTHTHTHLPPCQRIGDKLWPLIKSRRINPSLYRMYGNGCDRTRDAKILIIIVLFALSARNWRMFRCGRRYGDV